MVIKLHTAKIRNKFMPNFLEITSVAPEKSLLTKKISCSGRNNSGHITIRHRGGGHKRRYRVIDFRRNKRDVEAKIVTVEYDPNRSVRISLVQYKDGEKKYVLHPKELPIGTSIFSGENVPLVVGNSLPLRAIPLGVPIHNLELCPGRGGQLVRSAGLFAQIVAKEGAFVTVKLPSGEVRMLRKECYATMGQLDNGNHFNVFSRKAGRSRWLGIRPTVRGVAMNPCDHPHGGGEGRSPIGRSKPMTPWGKPALGVKTRVAGKYSDVYIIRRKRG